LPGGAGCRGCGAPTKGSRRRRRTRKHRARLREGNPKRGGWAPSSRCTPLEERYGGRGVREKKFNHWGKNGGGPTGVSSAKRKKVGCRSSLRSEKKNGFRPIGGGGGTARFEKLHHRKGKKARSER